MHTKSMSYTDTHNMFNIQSTQTTCHTQHEYHYTNTPGALYLVEYLERVLPGSMKECYLDILAIYIINDNVL